MAAAYTEANVRNSTEREHEVVVRTTTNIPEMQNRAARMI